MLFVLILNTQPGRNVNRTAIPDHDRPPAMAQSGLTLFEMWSVTVRSCASIFRPGSGLVSKNRSGKIDPWKHCAVTTRSGAGLADDGPA